MKHEFITRYRRTIITSTDKFLQTQLVEAKSKILKEIAFVGIITIAEYHFPTEVLPIMLQFSLNIRELSIELILLRHLSGIQISVCHILLIDSYKTRHLQTTINPLRRKKGVMPLIAFSTGRRRMEPQIYHKNASRL